MSTLSAEPSVIRLSGSDRVWELLRYARRSRGAHLLIAGVSVAGFVLAAIYLDSFQPPPLQVATAGSPVNWFDWGGRLQLVLGFVTLLVAVSVWCGELREDWEDALPSRMSVHFLHEGLPAIVCRNVWLAGEGDLRAWGQQVAAQAANERWLDFSPAIEARPPTIGLLPGIGICRHYSVRFHLQKKPPGIRDGCCRYQNLAASTGGVRDESALEVATLPEIAGWTQTVGRDS